MLGLIVNHVLVLRRRRIGGYCPNRIDGGLSIGGYLVRRRVLKTYFLGSGVWWRYLGWVESPRMAMRWDRCQDT